MREGSERKVRRNKGRKGGNDERKEGEKIREKE